MTENNTPNNSAQWPSGDAPAEAADQVTPASPLDLPPIPDAPPVAPYGSPVPPVAEAAPYGAPVPPVPEAAPYAAPVPPAAPYAAPVPPAAPYGSPIPSAPEPAPTAPYATPAPGSPTPYDVYQPNAAPYSPTPFTPSPNAYGQPPAYPTPNDGQPPVSSDSTTMSAIAHVSGIVVGFVGPLIVWAVKGNTDPFARANSVEALNFQFTVAIAAVVSFLLTFVVIGVFMLIALGICNIVFPILGTMAATRGQVYRYPVAIRFMK